MISALIERTAPPQKPRSAPRSNGSSASTSTVLGPLTGGGGGYDGVDFAAPLVLDQSKGQLPLLARTWRLATSGRVKKEVAQAFVLVPLSIDIRAHRRRSDEPASRSICPVNPSTPGDPAHQLNRFTRERSLVRAQPCPCSKLLCVRLRRVTEVAVAVSPDRTLPPRRRAGHAGRSLDLVGPGLLARASSGSRVGDGAGDSPGVPALPTPPPAGVLAIRVRASGARPRIASV